ncbi:MAG: CBS domain-containing protein [Candidatus Saccharimonadales bacterium]
MSNYIFSIILLIIALVCIELKKSYQALPMSELRYRARQGDVLAKKIYSAVAYEESLDILLWAVIVICASASIFLFNRVAPLLVGFIAVVLFIWLVFAWMPKRRMDYVSQKLAIFITPVIVWLLNYLHPLIRNVSKFSSKNLSHHTKLYDKNDLIKLIDNQKHQPDNRIDTKDLELIKKGLKLSGKTVGSYSQSWAKIHHTLAHEAIGPILLDELHKSGQLFVPVLEDNQSQKVIGMINTSGIDISKTGEIKDIVDSNVNYLNEDDSLIDSINAVALTGSPVFIVLDKKQRITGLITIKDIISQLFTLETNTRRVPEKEPET